MPAPTTLSEADIIGQVVGPRNGDLSPEAARALLQIAFDRPTTTRIRQLLRKNNRGTITTPERLTLEKYIRVGQVLDLLHAQARRVLTPPADSN